LREIEQLLARWATLTHEEAIPAETRRILKICLGELLEALAHGLMSEQHLSREHDE
jgi:hypothetical protein